MKLPDAPARMRSEGAPEGTPGKGRRLALVRNALIDYILSTFGLEEGELDDNTVLFSDGLLDSFCMVSLISYVESEAGITFRPTEVNLDNLDSVARILAFVERKSG